MSTSDTIAELAGDLFDHETAHPEYEADEVRLGLAVRATAVEQAQDEDNNESVPPHPLPHLQKVFEESIMESAGMNATHHYHTLDVQARRQQLLEHDDLNKGYSSRWRQSPRAKFHPLWKIISQISFGVHLLHKREAKSDHEVVKILQTHIDEVDSFAEETTDDFDLAIKDIEERIDCLDIPLQHSHEFNRMLCNTTFRTSILQNNDVIERIMYRTKRAMDTSLTDVRQGQDAVAELSRYLDNLAPSWPRNDANLLAAFETMKGNAEGWYRCFDQLRERGVYLTNIMMALQSTVDEMARRAGIASRRLTPTGLVGRKSTASGNAGSARTSTDTNSRKSAMLEKPLPAIPPPELPTSETDLKQSLAKAAHQKKLSLQMKQVHQSPQQQSPQQQSPHQQSPQLRKDSATSSPRYSTVAPLRVVTVSRSPAVTRPQVVVELPASHPNIIELPASQNRPHTPPRSSRRPMRTLSKDEAATLAMDSAYASCPETPTFPPKRSASSEPSPISSLASTPKTSTSQARDSMYVAPLAIPMRNSQGEEGRSLPLTALPAFERPITQSGPLTSPMSPVSEIRPLTTKKQHLATMKGLFGKKEKRQSVIGSIRGGFI